MTVFHDPGLQYGRPSLISDLLTVPATPGQHQLENQATTVLAWLIDRSPAFAGAFVRLFLGVEVHADEPVAARTQVSLPKPGGGALRPDLSVCVGDRRLQPLVEVKVDAELATYPELHGAGQLGAYRRLWSQLSDAEAKARAVGSLTRLGGGAAVDLPALTAREKSWRELRDEVDRMLAVGALEPAVAQVAASLVEAIDTTRPSRTPTASGCATQPRSTEEPWMANPARCSFWSQKRKSRGVAGLPPCDDRAHDRPWTVGRRPNAF